MRTNHPLRNLAFAAGLFAAVTGLLLATSETAWTDDVDLLRFDTGNPYLFIILDTSGSMNLPLVKGADPLLGDGDAEGSRIYQAKQAMYKVFKDVDDVHFGLATYNQDWLQITSKHWLYVPRTTATTGSWPLADKGLDYPSTADVLTFGKHIDSDGEAGSCTQPLDFPADREDISRFSKLDADGNSTTKIWVSLGNNKTYLLTVDHVAGTLGDRNTPLVVLFTAEKRSGNTCATVDSTATLTATLGPSSPFEFLMYDGPVADEASAGTWSYQDASAINTFGADRPFTGLGWEGNYDSTFYDKAPDGPAGDPWCKDDSSGLNKCLSLKFPTTPHPQFPAIREVDTGDVLTLDWRTSDGNKNEMLRRLAPNLRSDASANPDFGIASYFKDTADFPNGINTSHSLKTAGEIPLIACGNSPLGRVINDYRCWWNGTKKDEKCKGTRPYKDGFESLALQYDPEWGCRRPYLLLISDGEDNSTAESPNADVANLNSQSGIKTWAINLGDAENCKPPNKLHSITNQGKGECVTVGTPQQLEDELRKLLGQIREETRAFASAAVPSVQATVEDKIFLTNFTPIDGASVWDGHVHAFLKPLPLTESGGRPDTSIKCATKPANEQSRCHLWDAGEVLLNQSPGGPAADRDAAVNDVTKMQLGKGKNERRVLYAQEQANGTWTAGGRLFAQTETASDSDASPLAVDFWKGLGISFTPGNRPSEQGAEDIANRAVARTLWEKQEQVTQVINGVTTTKTITFALGDIFHSNPLVVGSPANTRYFADNTGTEGKTCDAGDKGYRCFFAKHEKRRKILVMGSNDGMVHAFDAGQWNNDNKKFNNGTGSEVFAFIPRSVMPKVRAHTETTKVRKWTVDGTLAVADFFIDPVHTGTPTAADREWRTVMLGGLREGGNGYFAIDITQPDELATVDSTKYVPKPVNDYVPSCMTIDSGTKVLTNPDVCGGIERPPFPAMLWEFRDAALDSAGNVVYDSSGGPVLLDEEGGVDTDGNGSKDTWLADLGETWSISNIGRIKLCEGSDCTPGTSDIKDKFVMVFGGGLDPEKLERRGNYIYMVDIETGKVIYKRRLEGSAASEPAAVDTDQDGYLDRIYIGTTKGFLYRIDLTNDSTGKVPKLEQVQVKGVDDKTYTANRVNEVDSASKPLWVPTKIFSTGGRPIYYRPSVLFVARLGRYALSFGTGEREDLWAKTGQEGRFYVFVDESDKLTTLPMTESDLQEVLVNTADVTNTDYLLGRPTGRRGWFLRLNVDERVITDSFALSGVSFFSSYQPDTCIGTLDPNTNVCTPPANNAPKLCAKTGKSRVFIVNTTNANSFMVGADGTRTKYFMVSNFVTNPYIEQGATKNPASSGSGTGTDADQLTASLTSVMEELKKLFPKNCRFANYRLDIKTISSDTGVVFIAPVPVCIVEKNWKEF